MSARKRWADDMEAARRGARTLVMGVLNVTPDSFSDGGRYFTLEKAVAHAVEMADAGAHILDIGGESTRPATFASNRPLPAEEELRRILPVVEALRVRLPDMPLSVDTYKAEVAQAVLERGAVLINDISALRADSQMASVVQRFDAWVCLMHMPGLPTALPSAPHYEDVVREVADHLRERVKSAEMAGIAPHKILIDPGIGFGKTPSQNLEILRRLPELHQLGYPLLVGTSRKSFIGKVLGGLPPEERLEGTAATVALAVASGAHVVRVHDVRAMVRVVRMADAVVRGWSG
ncbi:dihydropteroate synthase [Chthonomonas calidirosea]|uniref:Dihydropteroate synthase n=1 Tax=Chthonomonas calidirosea (strain DSM 23976 / ICMP 18418 / T49) TaxID=1303518 RepID=S0EWW2_CHTCT|nr:dihydropteroate synthase [Chthonomonas calidirosea]CCW35870.1 Dihydropteroate synthase [Chthonomonas calidirosea T49]CEK17974.1 dihydropteroate synthase [Chthonomonas calidirosea]CEK17976.1 dihydropteroate synthase [Chthonomonas calidirosea]CEK19001.1 dihydropteroate synthase [Chthonomonas calidirosea]